jgi:ABC-type dipeptide/oligopeptide/nickel transport system ATPase component/ABC-type dipeptide/oligopeptide/nickel transport system permease subunit
VTPAAVAAIGGGALLVVIAVLAPAVWGDAAATTAVADRLQRPSLAHLFGTDELGRDVFARVMVATRLSLGLALGATAVGMTGGILLGLTASMLPRRPRRLVTGLMDILLSFPWLLLVLFFSAIWGASAIGAMLAIGFAGIPWHARVVYTLASSLTGRDFVRAARVCGVGPIGVMGRHVLPNIANPLLVNAAAASSVALLSFAGLSFLGLGVQAPTYDWGRLLNEGILRIYVNPVAALGPGIAIVLVGVVFTLTSEAITTQQGHGFAAVKRLSKLALGLPPGDPPEASEPGPETVAEVRGLRIAFPDDDGGLVERVCGVDLTVTAGETLGIVGESGSGKSLTAMALAGLLEAPAVVMATTRRFDGVDMSRRLSRAEAGKVGARLGMVFQDPLTSLNPALTIGRQLTEVPEVHLKMSRREARARATAALDAVHIADPVRRQRRYPHEFSGGMRQRVMIGMALAGSPRLIIADEPTTALDVTVQRQVMSVLRQAQLETGAAIVFISHDIALVSAFCDRVAVMKDGLIVEELDARRIQRDAKHPYTRALVACLPDMSVDRTSALPVIAAETFPVEEAVL